jgi:hypothetical protein
MPKNFLANPPATDTATATVPVAASTTRSRTRQNPADRFSLSGEEHHKKPHGSLETQRLEPWEEKRHGIPSVSRHLYLDELQY